MLPASLVANGSHARRRRRFNLLWILTGIVFVLFAFFGFTRRELAQPKLVQFQPHLFAPTPPPAPPRIYLRAGDVGREGLGVRLLAL